MKKNITLIVTTKKSKKICMKGFVYSRIIRRKVNPIVCIIQKYENINHVEYITNRKINYYKIICTKIKFCTSIFLISHEKKVSEDYIYENIESDKKSNYKQKIVGVIKYAKDKYVTEEEIMEKLYKDYSKIHKN